MNRNHLQRTGGGSSLLLALALMLTASPTILEAQSITGTVRDQGTGNPVAAAQVFLEGLSLGASPRPTAPIQSPTYPPAATHSPSSSSATGPYRSSCPSPKARAWSRTSS